MNNRPVHFGKLFYRSELSPEQILHEVGQLTIPKKWLRSPFADFACPFEGTVGANSFELVCLNKSHSDRTIPKVNGTIAMDDKGRMMVLIELKKSFGAHLLNLMLVGASAFLCFLVFSEHNYLFALFAIMLAGLRWLRYLPDQFYTQRILDLLQQRLELTAPDSLPAL